MYLLATGLNAESKGAASRSSKGTKASVSSATTTGPATVIDMNEVKSIQSLVGCIVYSSDLPQDLQELMKAASGAVDMQRAANTVR